MKITNFIIDHLNLKYRVFYYYLLKEMLYNKIFANIEYENIKSIKREF